MEEFERDGLDSWWEKKRKGMLEKKAERVCVSRSKLAAASHNLHEPSGFNLAGNLIIGTRTERSFKAGLITFFRKRRLYLF